MHCTISRHCPISQADYSSFYSGLVEPHRFIAACDAMARLLSGGIFSILALRLPLPPFRPSATAAGFFRCFFDLILGGGFSGAILAGKLSRRGLDEAEGGLVLVSCSTQALEHGHPERSGQL